MRFAVTEGFHVGVTGEALEAHLDLVRRAISTSGGTLVDGNGSKSTRIRGLSFDLRSVGVERVGSA